MTRRKKPLSPTAREADEEEKELRHAQIPIGLCPTSILSIFYHISVCLTCLTSRKEHIHFYDDGFQIVLHVAVRSYGFQGITSDHEDPFLVRVQKTCTLSFLSLNM